MQTNDPREKICFSYLSIEKLIPLWQKEVDDAIDRSFQSEATDEQDGQDNVGEERSEVHGLSSNNNSVNDVGDDKHTCESLRIKQEKKRKKEKKKNPKNKGWKSYKVRGGGGERGRGSRFNQHIPPPLSEKFRKVNLFWVYP